jgi:hypothetical protein
LSIRDQINQALKAGGLTPKEIGERLNHPEGSIRARLNEMAKDQQVMKLPEIRDGAHVWGLRRG